jgi:hypothetical protein
LCCTRLSAPPGPGPGPCQVREVQEQRDATHRTQLAALQQQLESQAAADKAAALEAAAQELAAARKQWEGEMEAARRRAAHELAEAQVRSGVWSGGGQGVGRGGTAGTGA